MTVFKSKRELQNFALNARRAGKTIGLVPTMGYLHAGHTSLIDIARRRADVVIVSIFVNPTQFAPTEDLDRYPRDFERDLKLCTEHGADAIFAPEPGEMYDADASTWVQETMLSRPLCGASRPTFFRGVTTVVSKLFLLAQPDFAVFGLKVERRKVRVEELADFTEVAACGTAVVITPVGRIFDGDKTYDYHLTEIGPVLRKLYDRMTGIQYGEVEDTHNWTVECC